MKTAWIPFSIEDRILYSLAAVKLVFHLILNASDTFFRDEFYYMACGEHLAFGYVDHPPLVAWLAALSRFLFGDSVFVLRILPAVTGAVMIILAGWLTRRLGGRLFAQTLAALSVWFLPYYLATYSFFSMNAFDQLFWLAAVYLVVLLIQEEKPSLWIYLGLILGIGLLNKISVLFLGAGLFIGILLTPQRQWFLSKWIWICAAIAFGLFLPHILWQIATGWPTLEFMHNARMYKNIALSPLEFLTNICIESNPLLVPIWLTGVIWLFFGKEGKRFRLLGWIFVTVLLILITQRGKTYYFAPVFSFILPAGSVAIGNGIQRLGWQWLKPVVLSIVVLAGIATAPLTVPILSPEAYVAYSNAVGITPPPNETNEQAALPQFLADRYGWKEMVNTVGKVYQSLSSEEKETCVIYTTNYGRAGAIDFYGEQYGLPPARCGHNNYFLWGPGEKEGKVAIVFGLSKEDLNSIFEEVQQAAVHEHPHAMPYESRLPIYVCHNPRVSLQEIWDELKNYN